MRVVSEIPAYREFCEAHKLDPHTSVIELVEVMDPRMDAIFRIGTQSHFVVCQDHRERKSCNSFSELKAAQDFAAKLENWKHVRDELRATSKIESRNYLNS